MRETIVLPLSLLELAERRCLKFEWGWDRMWACGREETL